MSLYLADSQECREYHVISSVELISFKFKEPRTPEGWLEDRHLLIQAAHFIGVDTKAQEGLKGLALGQS